MESTTTASRPHEVILERYARFGVDLGLERVERLLVALGSPHQQVPIIHVAGTNGKGSVCALLSAVLAEAGYRVGRYTSPHLVSWCERICLNDQPIDPTVLTALLQQVEAAIDPQQPCPTQFEVITAAAWLYFAQQADIAVMEVGLGGRLDATNVCDQPLVTAITSISRDHWQRLGPTLADIAFEKAGILKPGRPAVIGALPPDAAAVVRQRIDQLGCPALWPAPAEDLGDGWVALHLESTAELSPLPATHLKYPLPLRGQHQRMNSAIAVTTLLWLRQQGWQVPDEAIVNGMAKAHWPGRLQWVTWQDRASRPHRLLIDGAHNGAAAIELRAYVDEMLSASSPPPPSPASPQRSVTWLMGMLSTKDPEEVFGALLRPGDRLHLVPVPGHLSGEPEDLAAIARTLCPTLAHCETHPDLPSGLAAATQPGDSPVVLCGSLYLIGHFFGTEPWQP